MAQEFPNPFFPSSTPGILYEYLKDQRWHDKAAIKSHFAAQGRHYSYSDYTKLREEGLKPVVKFPGGRWIMKAMGRSVSMQFNEPVEATGVDEKVVKQKVDEAVSGAVDTIVKERLEFHTKEHVKLIEKQIEELRKSSVPILELQRYEGSKKIVEKVQPAHEMMATLLFYISQGDHVYLHDPEKGGGPGSGKTTAAIMAAKALGRRVGYISLTPTTFESRLFGYMDAHGKYVTTDFRICYEKGGVFIIDEMDNGSGNLYTAINGALENNICSFPDKQVKRHPDFVCVGTGNTSGGGPSPMFPTRRPFDKAFAERFTYLPWGYDNRLERTVALSINGDAAPVWHDYMLKLRDYCQKHHPTVLVSPRATFKGCKYLRHSVVPMDLLLHGLIFKGVDQATVNAIITACPIPATELNEAVLKSQANGNTTKKKARAAKI